MSASQLQLNWHRLGWSSFSRVCEYVFVTFYSIKFGGGNALGACALLSLFAIPAKYHYINILW